MFFQLHARLSGVCRHAVPSLVVFASVVGAAVVTRASDDSDRSRPPNVILIMTDDQGYGDLGAHGNTMIRTPNLDRLHGQSIRFTDFHVDPTCSPTRAALMTGRYSTRTGVWHTVMGRSLLFHDEVTMADVFADNGYRTGIFGKWHLGDNLPMRPQDRGFERVVIHGGGGIGQTPDYWGNDYIDDHYETDGKWEPYEGYCTDVFFEQAKSFIQDAGDKPFFAYIPTNVPHGPFIVPPRYKKYYLDRGVPEPMASFYGMIENFDENIGRLCDWLDEKELSENTVLIFLTDNGTAAGVARGGARERDDRDADSPKWTGFNAGMRGTKGAPYEGGHRVPLFIRWPAGGIGGGKDVEVLSSHFDLLPTLVELCGLAFEPAQPLDGRSLVALLRDTQADWPDRTLFVHTQREEVPPKWKASSVMHGRWRYLNGSELYNLDSDPGQQNDVAAEHPEVVAQLREAYEAWWTTLEPAFERYATILIGDERANPTAFTCMDWHAPTVREIPWNQPHIEAMPLVNGWWMLEAAEPGRYAVTLRHKPAQVKFPLQADTAKVRFGDQQFSMKIEPGADSVTVPVELPAGPVRLDTELIDHHTGKSRGAFFVEIRRLGE